MNQKASPHQNETDHTGALMLDFPAAKTVRHELLFFVSYPVCGCVLWQPTQTKTVANNCGAFSSLPVTGLIALQPENKYIISYNSLQHEPVRCVLLGSSQMKQPELRKVRPLVSRWSVANLKFKPKAEHLWPSDFPQMEVHTVLTLLLLLIVALKRPSQLILSLIFSETTLTVYLSLCPRPRL